MSDRKISHYATQHNRSSECPAEPLPALCRIKVTFRDSKGNDVKTIEGNEGDDLLSLAHEYDIDLEG